MLTALINNLKQSQATIKEFLKSPALLESITALKRIELSNGLTGSGSDIRPYYSEVPIFMFWYNDWKKENVPTYKLDNVADLYIDGTFYASLYTVEVSPGVYQTDTDYSKAYMFEVMEMHDQGDLLDLTEASQNIVINGISKFVLKSINV